jgi:hypothetical protein
MTDTPDMSRQKLSVSAVLAYRRQLVEECQAKQNQLTETITESDREKISLHLAQLVRLLFEVDAELMQLLQTPLRPSQRRGRCLKAF